MQTTHTFLTKRVSAVDIATKYVFPFEGGLNTELVYVDNHSGKDIICVPSQTGCRLGCTFCHLTARGDSQTVRHLNADYTFSSICEVAKDLELPLNGNKTLLISFMGMGEPLVSPDYLLTVSDMVVDRFQAEYDLVRFGLATIVPSVNKLKHLQEKVKHPTKIHWSLHQPFDESRHAIMPNATPIELAAQALAEYRAETGNPIEIHYTVFNGNDSEAAAKELADIALAYDFPVKFLKFSERPDHAVSDSTRTDYFIHQVYTAGVKVEVYAPPGHDIQGACGEFEI